MKNGILLAVILVVMLGVPCKHVVAQIEIRYPNPAYMHWEEPCPKYLGYNIRNYCAFEHFPVQRFNAHNPFIANDHVCYINPFGTGDEKVTLYGVAVGIIDYNNYVAPFRLSERSISLDIMLYNYMSGDSNVQLVKRQTFVVEENQIPDLYMVYKALDGGHEGYYEDTVVKYPMYEFYFDEPVEMYGDFYVGIHSMDSFHVLTGNMNYMGTLGITDSSCCHSGYFGFIDMEREVLIYWDAYCFAADTYIGGGYYDDYAPPGLIAPRRDTVFNNLAQGALPITRPQGYLTATEPTAEAEVGSVRLLPNPARTRVTVEADCAIRHVEVADMAGRVQISERYDVGARSATLDVSRLAQGSYVARVKTEREETVQKLIIE